MVKKLIWISFFLILLFSSLPVFVYPVRADAASNGAQEKVEVNFFFTARPVPTVRLRKNS